MSHYAKMQGDVLVMSSGEGGMPAGEVIIIDKATYDQVSADPSLYTIDGDTIKLKG